MFRCVVTYDRYLCAKQSGLTKHERIYFENVHDAEDWMKVFCSIANNCFNFSIEEL